MSAIFELGYEFSDPFEKEMFLIEKSADIELRRIFDQMDICILMESSGKEEPGGLIGLIQKGFKVISDMLSSIISKIGQFLKGKKPTDENVNFKKNPKNVVENADKILKEDLSMLKDMTSGKIQPEKVKDAVDKHKNWFSAILPYVGPASALVTGALIDDKVLVSWRREIDQACSINYDALTDYSQLYARSSRAASKKAIIKEATQYLMKDIHDVSTKGSNAFTDCAKRIMVENKVKKIIRQEADGMDSRIGGLKYRSLQRMERYRLEKETDRLEKAKKRIGANIEANKKVKEDTSKARQKYADAKADFYVDVGRKKYYNGKDDTLSQ